VSACGWPSDESKETNPPQGKVVETPTEEKSEKLPEPKTTAEKIFLADEGVEADNGAFSVKAEWVAGPSATEENRLKLVFATRERSLPSSTKIEKFLPWMTVHGHGAPMRSIKVTANKEHENVFLVEGLYLIMSGPWDLFITAQINGKPGKATVKVEVP
jgi:hypothetical protein